MSEIYKVFIDLISFQQLIVISEILTRVNINTQ